MTQSEVNNTYFLVKDYLRRRDEENLTEFDKLSETDQYRVLVSSMLLKKRAEAVVSEITNDLLDIECNIGVLKGLEYRLKPFSSIVEKTISDSVDYNGSYERAARNINDSIRFTFVIPDDIYVLKIDECLHTLESMGYQVIEFKNKWNKLEYKGISARLTDKKNDNIFEIQFHTPLAYKIKEGDDLESQEHSTRSLYRVSRDDGAPEWLRLKVDKLRIYLQSFIETPEGALDYMYDSQIRRVR